MEGRLVEQVMEFFGWRDDSKRMVLHAYFSHLAAGENINWSALCDDLGVERRYYRGKMQEIYEEVKKKWDK